MNFRKYYRLSRKLAGNVFSSQLQPVPNSFQVLIQELKDGDNIMPSLVGMYVRTTSSAPPACCRRSGDEKRLSTKTSEERFSRCFGTNQPVENESGQGLQFDLNAVKKGVTRKLCFLMGQVVRALRNLMASSTIRMGNIATDPFGS